MKSASLLECGHLRACDEYFSNLISHTLLGDIVLCAEEIDYLAGLISEELQKPYPRLEQSLSVAVFLVWMGILHYREGNFWTPVYKKLGLPSGQNKWQSTLGGAFLRVINKYQLLEIRDKQTYINILAHGYVPDYYLDSYISDCIFRMYKEREYAGQTFLSVEIRELVSQWRRDVRGYEELHLELNELDAKERSLQIVLDTFQNQDKVRKYNSLVSRLDESSELLQLINIASDWLEQLRAEKGRLQEQLQLQANLSQRVRGLEKQKEAITREVKELEQQITNIGQKLFSNWAWDHTDNVLAVSAEVFKNEYKRYVNQRSCFQCPWGWLYRIIFAKRYRQFMAQQGKISNFFGSLIIQDEILESGESSPDAVIKLQTLLTKHQELLATIYECDQAWQEVGAELDVIERTPIQQKLNAIKKDMEVYNEKVTKVGNGNFEDGLTAISKQRALRAQLAELREGVNSDLTTLLACLPEIDKYQSEKEIKDELIKIRKQRERCNRKLRVYENPLYTLNESTRALLFHGGERAVQFVYNCLHLIRGLDQGIETTSVEAKIPSRIADAIKDWWHEKGRAAMVALREEQTKDEGHRVGGANVRRPRLKFDTQTREIKVVLPQEPVSFQSNEVTGTARFTISGELGVIDEIDVPVRKSPDGGYYTVQREKVIDSVQPIYAFTLSCGDFKRRWENTGLGWSSHCMLFGQRGEYISQQRLPEKGAWIIAPQGSKVEPTDAVIERDKLWANWSGYESIYVELDDTDLLVVKNDANIDLLRRQSHLNPTLIEGKQLSGVHGDDNTPVYIDSLPCLAFSVSEQEELPFFSLKIECGGQYKYSSVDKLDHVLSKDMVVYIDLNQLCAGEAGEYEISLSRRNQQIWDCKFINCPEFNLSFSQPVYRLVEDVPGNGQLRIRSSCPLVISPTSKNVKCTEEVTTEQIITFETTLNIISGKFIFNPDVGSRVEINLNIDVPCIRWRWAGEDVWNYKLSEIWHEDLGEIEIKVPPVFKGVVQLSVQQQILTSRVRNSIAILDISKFADTLRDKDQALHDVLLSSNSFSQWSCVMMRIRCFWQVAKLKVEQAEESDMRFIKLNWEDKGQPENRVLRLWPLFSGAEMLECDIPDGNNCLDIQEPLDKLPSGNYRLQFDVVDLWASNKASLPEKDARNCKEITLGKKIEPPVLRWRLGNKREWKRTPGSVWFDELVTLNLLVQGGSSLDVKLIVADETLSPLRVQGNIYRYDLRDYREIIENSGMSPYLIHVEVDGYRYELLQVYTAWEVSDIVSRVFREDKKWGFFLAWQESFNAPGRMVRIWSGDLKGYREWEIPDGELAKLSIKEPMDSFSPGRYILQFILYDPQESSQPEKPKLDGKNEHYLDIPSLSDKTSQKTGSSGKIRHRRRSEAPEYYCPRHHLKLPTGTLKCDMCDYRVNPRKKSEEED